MTTVLTILAILVVGTLVLYYLYPELLGVLRLRAKKVAKDVTKKVNNPLVTADIRIEEAKEKVANFRKNITDLRKQVIKEEKRKAGLLADQKKWEAIYVEAIKAGNTEDAEKASNNLERVDTRLAAVDKLIQENREAIEEFSEQAQAYASKLEHTEILKENLEVRQISANLRKEASSRGKLALDGLGALSDLEELVEDTEAEAEANEEEAGLSDSNLEEKYSAKSVEHSERLKKLLEAENVEASV